MIFCHFYHHSVDHVRRTPSKPDHTSSKKHMKRKEAALKLPNPLQKQTSLPGVTARTESGEARKIFCVDFVKTFVHANIVSFPDPS